MAGEPRSSTIRGVMWNSTVVSLRTVDEELSGTLVEPREAPWNTGLDGSGFEGHTVGERTTCYSFRHAPSFEIALPRHSA